MSNLAKQLKSALCSASNNGQPGNIYTTGAAILKQNGGHATLQIEDISTHEPRSKKSPPCPVPKEQPG